MLRFEKFTQDHIDIYYKWRNVPEVAIFDQSAFLRPMSFEEVASWADIMVQGLSFMVYNDKTPIGFCAFMHLDQRNRHAELAIVIGNKDYWSKGFGSLIMEQVLEWGFEGLNLNRLYLHVFEFNERAIGLYEKMGFILEGRKRAMLYRRGKYQDLLVYGLMKDEYKKKETSV